MILRKLNIKRMMSKFVASTVELLNETVQFHAKGDLNLKGLPQNEVYIERELEWYKSQSLDIEPLNDVKIWTIVCDNNHKINSNYGFLIFSSQNGNQFENVYKELKRDINSRRAVMYYTNPWMHHQGGKDHVCTAYVSFLYRDGTLNCYVSMRSNDVIFGMRNDLPWHQWVLETMAMRLGIRPGYVNWHAVSLHVYERHYDLLEKVCKEN